MRYEDLLPRPSAICNCCGHPFGRHSHPKWRLAFVCAVSKCSCTGFVEVVPPERFQADQQETKT